MGAMSAMATGKEQQAADFVQVFCRSLAVVGVAELFDKTWFMGLLLALRYRAVTVFSGSITALLLHTVLAAALGYAFARLISPAKLNFLAASLFLVFAILYAKEFFFADPEADAIAAGRKEAAEDCGMEDGEGSTEEGSSGDEEEEGNTDTYEKAPATESNNRAKLLEADKADGANKDMTERLVFAKSFTAVFIAEWGDRTQIAMVGQHASQPLVPVFLGSAVAFVLLTLSAVLAASLLTTQKLSGRLVSGVSAVMFAAFALLALRDALAAATGN